MSKPLFTGTETNIIAAMRLFVGGLTQRPEVYSVPAADVAEACRLLEELERLVALTSRPEGRNPVNTAAKRATMDLATKHCRRIAAFIRVNPNLSDADHQAVGVPAKAEKRRIPPPTGKPMLEPSGIIPGGHIMNFCDASAPDSRRKPEGVQALELWVAYSPMGSELKFDDLIRKARPHTRLTRTGSHVLHADEQIGMLANYIGRWVNARGEAGPWSQPARMMLALPLARQERIAA